MSTMVDQEDHSTLSMNQLLLEALDHRWKNYDAELNRCRSDHFCRTFQLGIYRCLYLRPGTCSPLLEQCHAAAISACMKSIQQLDTSWRSAPDQSFPWEK